MINSHTEKNMSGHYADIKNHQYNIRGSIFLCHEKATEIQLVSISTMEQTQSVVLCVKKKEVNFVASVFVGRAGQKESESLRSSFGHNPVQIQFFGRNPFKLSPFSF